MSILPLPILNRLSTILLLSVLSAAEAETRLVSTDAQATELIFALGADQDLVAVDVTSHLPEGYRSLKNVGYHRNLSAEGMLSLQPTLVIGSEHMGPSTVLDTLRQANVTLLQLPAPYSVTQLQENIRRVAKQLQNTEAISRIEKKVQQHLDQLHTHNLEDRRGVFLLMMDARKLRLAGKGTTGAAFIQLTGGSNAATFDNYRDVSAESLLAMDPDFIILASQETSGLTQQFLEANPILSHSRAARENKIVSMDGSTLVAGLSLSAISEAGRIVNQIMHP